MTPIDGRRNPKGDRWVKPLPKGSISGRKGGGCLRVLLPSPGCIRVIGEQLIDALARAA